jgi:hypothetical protein
MKGDYSEPGLMPGHCSEQIDLPSAYLVYAVGSLLRRQGQRWPGGGAPFSYGLISARILHDLVEIMVLVSLKRQSILTGAPRLPEHARREIDLLWWGQQRDSADFSKVNFNGGIRILIREANRSVTFLTIVSQVLLKFTGVGSDIARNFFLQYV